MPQALCKTIKLPTKGEKGPGSNLMSRKSTLLFLLGTSRIWLVFSLCQLWCSITLMQRAWKSKSRSIPHLKCPFRHVASHIGSSSRKQRCASYLLNKQTDPTFPTWCYDDLARPHWLRPSSEDGFWATWVECAVLTFKPRGCFHVSCFFCGEASSDCDHALVLCGSLFSF